MIRSSSSITGHLNGDNPARIIFQEIQNITPIEQYEHNLKLPFVSIKKSESMTSDEINNSENTRIIDFGPSRFENEDTLTSEETLSDVCDLNQTLAINSDDKFLEQIDQFLVSNNGTFLIDEEKFEISQELLLESIDIVETFNQVLYSIYSCQIPIEKLNLKFFIKSVLHSVRENSYFISTVKTLIRILVHSEVKSLGKIQMFNVNLINLLNHNYLSDKTKILILIRIFESYKTSNISAIDKSVILTKNSSCIEQQIDTASDLNELSANDKLHLVNYFIEILISKKSNYDSKLEDLDKNINVERSKLQDLKHKYELNRFKLDNISKYLLESDESLIKNHLSDIKDKMDCHDRAIEESKQQMEAMLRCQPFCTIDLDGHNVCLYFWRFNCLKNFLCVEKRFKSDNYRLENGSFDLAKEKSEWFLLCDRASIIELKKKITANICDLNFENTMLKIIASTLINRSFNEHKEESTNEMKENDEDSTIISFLTAFKHRILDANFLFFKTNFDREKNSITSYTIDESYYKFNEIMSKISDSSKTEKKDKVNDYIELTVALYKMIDQKFLTYKFPSNFGPLWLNMIASSKSVDNINLCLLFLDLNVLWEKKISDTSTHCLICRHASFNQPLNLKITCSDCHLSYHVDCLVENSDKTILDPNNNPLSIKLYKNKAKYLCSSCNEKSVEKIKTETELKLQEIDDKVSQLSTIKINRYSLRLNKQRVTNLDKSSSEESIDLKSKKRKKKKEKNDEEEIWKPAVASENELEDLDIKRARLGLRIRPKATRPKF